MIKQFLTESDLTKSAVDVKKLKHHLARINSVSSKHRYEAVNRVTPTVVAERLGWYRLDITWRSESSGGIAVHVLVCVLALCRERGMFGNNTGSGHAIHVESNKISFLRTPIPAADAARAGGSAKDGIRAVM